MGISPIRMTKFAGSAYGADVISYGAKMSQRQITSKVNLMKFFKKGLHDYDQIEGILYHLPEEEKFLGALPNMWRKLFRPSEIPEKTQEMHNIFYDFAKNFQSAKGHWAEETPAIKKLAKTLEVFFKSKIEANYIDEGMFGSVIRIEGAKEDLALKVFHEVPEMIEPSSVGIYKRHGQTIELQNAIALTHGLRPSQRARFYMGRITSLGENGGYMLSEFVKSGKKSFSLLPEYTPREDFIYSRFVYGDRLKFGNILDGKLLDFGDISYKFPNKEQADIAKKIFPLICKGDTKKLIDIKKQYKDNPDFEAVVKNSSSTIVRHLSYPFNLISFMKSKGAKEVLSSLTALGVEFPELKTYKQFKPEQILFLKSTGVIK